MGIRIVVVDDHQVVRYGLCSALEKEEEMEVVAEAENGRSAISLARKYLPDVILMDVQMPELNGVEATRQIVSEHPGIKVIALTMSFSSSSLMGMLKAGASGFLLKTCTLKELTSAVRSVAAGKCHLSPDITGSVIEVATRLAAKMKPSDLSMLSAREREVVHLVAEGYTNKAIGDLLSVSEATIESHRRQIMRKLHLRSMADLIKFAIREGLTQLDP